MELNSVTGERLRSAIERIERLEEEKKSLQSDIKNVYSEAKGAGFDIKIVRRIVQIRKVEEHRRNEEFALLKLYCRSIQMELPF